MYLLYIIYVLVIYLGIDLCINHLVIHIFIIY